jgi:hypothetical protein
MTDNARLKRTFEFDLADAPVLMRAFSIAACTAMLCGHHTAKRRLDEYKAMMAQFVPPEAALFDEEEWCEIGIALVDAESFSVVLEAPRWERDRGTFWRGLITVRVGDKVWQSDSTERYERGDPKIAAVHRVLAELAPIGCEGILDDGNKEPA